MSRRIRGVAVLACAAVVGAIGITAAVASAAERAPAADALLSRNKPVTASSSGSCCAGSPTGECAAPLGRRSLTHLACRRKPITFRGFCPAASKIGK